MKQMTFADAKYSGKRKQTRKELFLIEMDQVVPWNGLIKLIEPFYPKGEGGRPAYPLMTMLRVHLMQNWFGYSDPAMEEALYETTILRQFAGLNLERIPDETTILNFRRLLEKHELAAGILAVINGYLGDRGLSLRQGTIVDATLINAPSSTKNKLVQWVEVVVSEYLAGQDADRYAVCYSAIVKALVRRYVGQQFARTSEGVWRATGIVQKCPFTDLQQQCPALACICRFTQ